MSEQIEQISLPPGWDCKYDPRTGRYYYVNLFTKTTTWEDPRARFRQLQTGAPLHISNDNISVQPVHGSPYHVYPSSNSFYPAQQAFQNPPSGVPSLTASPNFANKLQQQQQMELGSMTRSSPHTPRMGISRHVMQETSFSNNVTAADTDATVAKINSMFPTVPETHIRMLLKKYLKSFFPKAEETLILDVLANADNNVQTASQQLIKMGYEKRDQPVNQRGASRKGSDKDGQQPSTSSGAIDSKRAETQTPVPKAKTPEERKKIKAQLQKKYKDIAERIISMALESVDYSEERAKQILNIVQQEDKEKKKSVKIDAPHKPEEDKENAAQQQGSSATPSRSNSTSSNSHPSRVKKAQGSVDSDDLPPPLTQEELALLVSSGQIMPESVVPDESNAGNENDASIEITTSTSNSTAIIKDSPQSPPSPSHLQQQSSTDDHQPMADGRKQMAPPVVAKQNRTRAKSDHAKYSIFRSSSSEDELDGSRKDQDGKMTNAKSSRIATKGPNMKLFRGPNDDLLLADYVTWNGANPDLARGSQKLALGADRTIRLVDRSYTALGPNGDLCKGPATGLAKGSIYSQMQALADVKCN
ncbi:uncharacterized protein LOC129757480 isoform X4 [Uranotaenia lowii]|uniref:uncharacterized protein LOC129757480 isoform X4 n=1 Tax=Uranotaenia lowii TaxID=190385 RepID=UPI00247A0D83|nr:uncharacterized protein LOC129757480 isoform X4 [Uranotaenia lowii]